MNTAVKSKRIPKPLLQKVIGEYAQLVDNLGGIIRETGYKQNFIARKLSMPISTFYLKKRTSTFTLDEVTQIVDLLDEDVDIENKYLIDLAESRWDEENMSFDDMMKLMEE